MNARRKMDLRNFFSSVKKERRLANLSVQNFREEEREATEAVKKDMRHSQMEEQRELGVTSDVVSGNESDQ